MAAGMRFKQNLLLKNWALAAIFAEMLKMCAQLVANNEFVLG